MFRITSCVTEILEQLVKIPSGKIGTNYTILHQFGHFSIPMYNVTKSQLETVTKYSKL